MNPSLTPQTANLWIPGQEVLYFALGGRALMAVRFNAVVLNKPFNPLALEMDATEPPWSEFPANIEAAVVPAQPATANLGQIALLRHSVRHVTYATRYFIDLQTSFAEYLNKLSQNSRHNLRRRVRRFTEFSGGRIQWQSYRSPEEMSEFYRLATEISARSWNEAQGGPGFSGTFGKDRVMTMACQDLGRSYLLFHKERPLAFAYCEIQEKNVVYLKIGYDQGYANWSPGTVLFYLFMESIFAEGKFEYFDFAEGELWYKSTLATGSMRYARLTYFRRRPKNILMITASHSLDVFSTNGGRFLERLGIKRLLKKTIMGRTARPGQV